MAMSKDKKLPPNKYKLIYGSLSDDEMYYVNNALPPNLYYQDVDLDFLRGMIAEMKEEHKVDSGEALHSSLKYPGGKTYIAYQADLCNNAQKLKLRNDKQYTSVVHDLDSYNRKPIEISASANNALEAVLVQVYTPPHYGVTLFRHQICCHMAEFVHFYYPRMEKYLKKKKISYTRYLEKLFTGEIWCDEYVLGAISKMWNIRITVVSPLFAPAWDVFHDGAEPHIVLIANGSNFGEKYGVTHFSSSKGKGTSWKCIGPQHRIAEIGSYKGYTTGVKTAVQLFENIEKRLVAEKAVSITNQFNHICAAMSSIEIRKDRLIECLEDLNVNIDHLKRFKRYHVLEVDPNVSAKIGPQLRQRQMPGPQQRETRIPKIRVPATPDYISLSDVENQMTTEKKISEQRQKVHLKENDKAVTTSQKELPKIGEEQPKVHVSSKIRECAKPEFISFSDAENQMTTEKNISEERQKVHLKEKDKAVTTSLKRLPKISEEQPKVHVSLKIQEPVKRNLISGSDVENQMMSGKKISEQRQKVHLKEKDKSVATSLKELLKISEEQPKVHVSSKKQSDKHFDSRQKEKKRKRSEQSEADDEIDQILFKLRKKDRGMIDDTLKNQPGVVGIESVEEKSNSDDDDDEIKCLDEYYGKGFGDEEKQERRSDNIPIYEELRSDAPDNTVVNFKGIAFEKGAVDMYHRLKPNNVAPVHHSSLSTDQVVSTTSGHGTFVPINPSISTSSTLRTTPIVMNPAISTSSSSKFNCQMGGDLYEVTLNKDLNVVDVHVMEKREELSVYIPQKKVDQHVQRTDVIVSSGAKKFVCKYCSKEYMNKNYRDQHEDRMCNKNPNPKLIKCEDCGKEYKHMGNYKDHRSSVHGDAPLHLCKICGAIFSHQNSLVRHKKKDH